MIRNARAVLKFFISIINWGDLFNGFLLLLLGFSFNRHYGYRFEWGVYLSLGVWFFFLQASANCLGAVLSGEVFDNLDIAVVEDRNAVEFRLLMVKCFWILAILFALMSFLPLVQIKNQVYFSYLSLFIVSTIYFCEYLFFIESLNNFFGGMREFLYAFSHAFLLPALCFSLSQDYIRANLILIIFPLFIQLIAWKTSFHLQDRLEGKKVPSSSMLEKVGSSNSLYIIVALLVLGCITLFLEVDITGILNKIFILPVGAAAAWLTFRSIRKQEPNWNWALALIKLLPAASILSIVSGLWVY